MGRSPATFLPIQRKILLTFALSSVIAVVLVGGSLRYALQKAILDNWEKDERFTALRMALRYESNIAAAQSDLEFAAALPAFSSLPYVDRIDPSIHGVPEDMEVEKREVLRHLREKGEGFSVVYVLRPDGAIYLVHPFAVQRTINRDSLSDRPYFQEAARTKRPVVSDSLIGADRLLCVVILVPVLDQAGSATAYLGGVFHLDRLSQLVAKEWIAPFDMGFLVDRQGYLIAHTNTELLREGVRERTTSHPLVAEFLSSQRAESTGQSAEAAVRECVDPLDGKTYITAFAPMRVGWGFGLARSKEAVFAEIRPIVWETTALAGVLFLAVSGVGVFFARRLSRSWEATERALRLAGVYNRSLIEASLDPLATIGPDGKITDVSTATEQVTGYSRGELIGRDFSDYFTEPEKARAGYEQVFRDGIVRDYALEIRHRDGHVTPVLYNASVYRDEEGSVIGVFAAARDVTARKRAEDLARRSARELAVRNRIADVFLTVPDEEMYANVLAIILEVMESKFGVFGYIDEHGALIVPTMTRTVWDKCQVPDKRFVFPREIWGCSSWPRAIRQRQTICLNEPSALTPEGHITITRHISLPLIHQNEVVGLIQIANKETDYTEEDIALLEAIGRAIAPVLDARLKRERQEERLKRLLADLERSNRELEQFAYVASHDLQEPLRMVASFTQLLGERYKGKLDQDADDFIRYAVDGANHLQALINDLLSYSRVSTRGKAFEPTDCETVLARVHANLLAMIEETGAILVHDPLPTVVADETQMVQLFQNLVHNAIKFRRDEAPRIHVAAHREGDEWVFSVRDNGIGIDAQYFDRIFAIFQRLHGKEEYPGTGIGLAVCKRIIERHGGRIWVESQPGKGSVFYFTLPTKPMTEKTDAKGER